MKKNFVQIRFETNNNSLNVNNVIHNLRLIKTKNQINDNDNILIYKDVIYNDNKKIKEKYSEMENLRKEHIKEHNRLYKLFNGNRKLKNYHGSIFEGIITFSNSLNDKINDKDFLKKFIEKGKETVRRITKITESELLYISIHLDEETPHFHFHLKNYDNVGKSIHNQIKTKQMGVLFQDIVGEEFAELGFNRGVSKEITNKNHQKTEIFHQMKIKEVETEYKELLELTKTMREELKTIEMETEKKKEEYKEITKLQTEIREELKTIRQTKEQTKGIIQKEINKIVVRSTETQFMGKKINELLLRTNLKSSLIQFTKLEIFEENLRGLEAENKKLNTENENLKETTLKIGEDLMDSKIIINKLNGKLEKELNNSFITLNQNEELKKRIKTVEEENKNLKDKYEKKEHKKDFGLNI